MSRFNRFVCLETLAVLAFSFTLSAPGVLSKTFRKKAAWRWDMTWDDGAMFKGGYSGQGIFVDPGRDIVSV